MCLELRCLQVAIKKITNVFEHVSDATRILREIKLLRLLKHPGRFGGEGTVMKQLKRFTDFGGRGGGGGSGVGVWCEAVRGVAHLHLHPLSSCQLSAAPLPWLATSLNPLKRC